MSEETAPAAPAAAEATQAEIEASVLAHGEAGVGLRALVEAGVHFGHQTHRWNPKMRPYIYGTRNGIHIVDLDQTLQMMKRALAYLTECVAKGGHVLFIGTKRQAHDTVIEEATRAEQFFVTGRWLGGTLTNYRTMRSGIDRLRELERFEEDGTLETFAKKEALLMRRERDKLDRYLGGIKAMNGLPAALFVIDPHHEHIAIREANRLNIPIVALTDTNCDPTNIDYLIPGNDDAMKSTRLITSAVADACIVGMRRRRSGGRTAQAGDQLDGVQVDFARSRGRGGRAPQEARA